MKVLMGFRFQNFPIYTTSRELVNDLYKLCLTLPKSEKFVLTSQLKRAVVSILLNIAEGSMKKSDKELRRFLLISAGSIGEIVAILDLCSDQKYIDASTHKRYMLKCQSLITQVYAFSKSLVSKA